MESRHNSFIFKLGTLAALFAYAVSLLSVNSACMWLTYQPEEPDEIKALKKH